MPSDQKTIDLSTDFLSGDVRTAILDHFRAQDMTWGMMTETQQRDLNISVDQLAKFLVEEAVKLVAAKGQPVIRATCGEVKRRSDGDIEAKIKLGGEDEQRHELFDATGSRITIIVSDHERYIGEREAARVDPDQPSMIDDLD